jgi:DNA-binding NarL/FixJ family response regulator
VRVVVADDTMLVRQGLRRLLDLAGHEVAGEAVDAATLLALVEAERPDAAIVDIRMPPSHTDEGLQATDALRNRFPGLAVLVLSQYTEPEYAARLLEDGEGGRGYLLKERVAQPSELIDALERVADGGIVVDRELVDQLLSRRHNAGRLAELTGREREVLALMAEGLTDRGIAERLWLTRKTVETHVRHILRKLDLREDASSNRRVLAVLTYLRAG